MLHLQEQKVIFILCHMYFRINLNYNVIMLWSILKYVIYLQHHATQISKKVYSQKRNKQLYFTPVLIYTSNKVKLKEGKKRNGLRYEIFLFSSKNLYVVHYLLWLSFTSSSSRLFIRSERFFVGKYKNNWVTDRESKDFTSYFM